MTRIKMDEKLFDEWNALGIKVSMMGSIIQNDVEVPYDQYLEWDDLVCRLEHDLENLIYRTKEHINKDNQ